MSILPVMDFAPAELFLGVFTVGLHVCRGGDSLSTPAVASCCISTVRESRLLSGWELGIFFFF